MNMVNPNTQYHKHTVSKSILALASLVILLFLIIGIAVDSHATTLTTIATAADTVTVTKYPLQKAAPQELTSATVAPISSAMPETANTTDPSLVTAAPDTFIAARDPHLRPRGTGGANATLLSRPGSSAPIPVVVSTSNATSTRGNNPHLNALPVASTTTNGTDIGAAAAFGFNATHPGGLDPAEQGGLPKMKPITF